MITEQKNFNGILTFAIFNSHTSQTTADMAISRSSTLTTSRPTADMKQIYLNIRDLTIRDLNIQNLQLLHISPNSYVSEKTNKACSHINTHALMCLFSIERLTFMNERKNSLGTIIPSWDKKQDLFASNGFKCQCGK